MNFERIAVATLSAILGALVAASASAATLDRIRETGSIRLGYLADARPFSFGTRRGPPRATPSRFASRSPIRSRRNSRCRA